MAFGAYFKLKEARDVLDIQDTVDDPELTVYGLDGNQQVDVMLDDFAEILPLTGDDAAFATKAVNYWVASRYKAKRKNFDAANYYKDAFELEIGRLQNKFKKTPTTKHKRVSVKTSHTTVPLFVQTKKF